MAYSNLYNGYWTNGDPLIPLTISYDHRRDGADMKYKIRVSIGAVTGQRYYGYPIYCTIKVDGTTIANAHQMKGASPSQWSSAIVYEPSEATVANKLSGTTALSIRLYASGGSSRDITYNLSMAVDVNVSDLTYSADVTIGTPASFTITPADPDYEHRITFLANDIEEEILAQGTALSASWTPPASWYDQMPNAQTLAGVFRLYCYLDGVLVGYSNNNATLHVPSSAAPTISALTVSPVNTNAWFASKGLYIVGSTKARVQTSYSLSRGASLEDILISLASGVQSGSGDDWTSEAIYSVGTKSVDVTVTDSRGMSSTATSSFAALAYALPSLAGLTYARGTYSGGVWTDNAATGQDLKITYTANLSLTAQGNTGALTTKVDGATVDTRTLTAGTNTVTIYKTSYGDTPGAISVSLTDDVGNTATGSATITGVSVPFNINTHLPGFGMGKMAETAKTLEVANDWDIVRNGVSAFGGGGLVDLTTDVTGILPIVNGGTGYAGVETLSVTATRSSGSSSVQSCTAYRFGKVVHLYLLIRTSASISAGSVIFEGSINGHYPVTGVSATAFSGSYVSVGLLRDTGTITIRETIGTIPTNYNIGFCFTYIEA